MRKSKFLLYGISALICAIPLLCTCFAEKNFVDISDDYFTGDINPGNQSAVYLNQSGTDGFGFFFLGDKTIGGTYELTLNNELEHETTITCAKQLKGYYTNNFLNFGMLPIDPETATRFENNGIKLITGGLYTDCITNGGTTRKIQGVYGYIKREYRSGGIKNSQEIWAGIYYNTENKPHGWTFKSDSDLQLVTSENGKYKALSGFIQDNLGKRSKIVTNFFERVLIDIPDIYFEKTNTLSGNRNESMFYGNGINGYGLFFLGTGIQSETTIVDKGGQKLTCQGQINGYYLLSFNDFGMFPLDKKTSNQVRTGGIEYIDGGLYYNCQNAENGKIYTGVYGHIVREYQNGHNGVNTHEIRAGISKEGKRVPISPIELTFSDNTWNTERSLSGYYFSSLAKNGQVFPRFFGDLGLSDNEGNNLPATDEDIGIDYEKYLSGEVSLYIKTNEVPSYITKREISKDGYFIIASGNENEPLRERIETNHGFYGLKTVDFPTTTTGLKTGTISTTVYDETLENSRTKTLKFHMTNTTPDITIEKFPDSSVLCTTGITFTVSANKDTHIILYTIIDTNTCDNENVEYTDEYTGPLTIDNDIYNNKYICFKAINDIDVGYASYHITGLDTTPPRIINIINATGYECGFATGKVIIEDGGCGNQRIELTGGAKSGIQTQNGLEFQIGDSANTVSQGTVPFTLKDTAGNETTGEVTLYRQDIPVSGQNFYALYNEDIDEETNAVINISAETNRRLNSKATAGSCETINAEVIECDQRGIGFINGDLFHYQRKNNGSVYQRNGYCRVNLLDDDGSKEVTVSIIRCLSGCISLEPEIIGGEKFVNRCSEGETDSNVSGTFLDDSQCYSYYGLPKNSLGKNQAKYTSGSKVIVQVNPSTTGSKAKQYRVSCIPEDTYCTQLGSHRNDIGCNDIYSGFYEQIYGCTLGNGGCSTKIAKIRTNTCEGRPSSENCKCSNGRFGNRNCTYEIRYKSCDWINCYNTPTSGYFENILGCTRDCRDVRVGSRWYSRVRNECNRWDANGNRCTVQNKEDMALTLTQYTTQCNEMRDVITANNGGYNCEKMEMAWSDWMDYPGNSYLNNLVFERDLETGSGCAKSGNVTLNGSKYLGERSVRVQLKDQNGVLSNKTKTDIVVYDIPDYTNITNYDNEGEYPLLTEGSHRNTSLGFTQLLKVKDIDRLLGIGGYTGTETRSEQQIRTLYETYIKAYSPISIGKTVTSEWFMKGVCQHINIETGTFNTYINDTCRCIEGDSCSGDIRNFQSEDDPLLTGHIPAIDNGCIELSAIEKTGVSLEELDINQNIICENPATFNESGDVIYSGSLTGVNCDNIEFDHWELITYSYTGQEACDYECATNRQGCYKPSIRYYTYDYYGNRYPVYHDDTDATKLTTCIGEDLTKHGNYSSGPACNAECTQGNCYDGNGNKIYSCIPDTYDYYDNNEGHAVLTDPVECNNICAQGLCWYRSSSSRAQMDSCRGFGTQNISEYYDSSSQCNAQCAQGKCYEDKGTKHYNNDTRIRDYFALRIDSCYSTIDTSNRVEFSGAQTCKDTCKNKSLQGDGCYGEGGINNNLADNYYNCESTYTLKAGFTNKLTCDQNCRSDRCFSKNGNRYTKVDSCLGSGTTQSQNFETEAACVASCNNQNGNCYDANRETTTGCIKVGQETVYFTGINALSECTASCQNGNCYNNDLESTGTCESRLRMSIIYPNEEVCKTNCNEQNGNCYDNSGNQISECIRSNIQISSYAGYNRLNNRTTCRNQLTTGNIFDIQGNTATSCLVTGDIQYTGIYNNKVQCDTTCNSFDGNCYDNSGNQINSCYITGDKQTFTTTDNKTGCNTACIANTGNCYDASGNDTTSCYRVPNSPLKTSNMFTNLAQCNNTCSSSDDNCYDNNGYLTGSCFISGNLLTVSTNYTDQTTCNNDCKSLSGNCYNNSGQETSSCYKINTTGGSIQTSSGYTNQKQCDNICNSLDGNCYNNAATPQLTGSCYKSGNAQTSTGYTNQKQCDIDCKSLSGNCYNNDTTPQQTNYCFTTGLELTTGNYTDKDSCNTACRNMDGGNCYDKNGIDTSECFMVTGGNLTISSGFTDKTGCDTACNSLDGNCYNNNGNTTNSCYVYNTNGLTTNSDYRSSKSNCNEACRNMNGNCYDNSGNPTTSCYKSWGSWLFNYYEPTQTSTSYNNNQAGINACNEACRNMNGNCYDNSGNPTTSCYKSWGKYYYKYYDDFRYNYYNGSSYKYYYYNYRYKYYDLRYKYYNRYDYYKYKYNDLRYNYYSSYSYKYDYYNYTFNYFKDFYFGYYNYSFNYKDYYHNYYDNIYYNKYDSFYYYDPTYYFYTSKYYYYTYPKYYYYKPDKYRYYTASGFHYHIPTYNKEGCDDLGYDYCTEYVCTKHNTENTFECSYPMCTNYGTGCLLYDTTTIQTGNYIQNADCTCLNVTGEAQTLGADFDETKYGCYEMENNPGKYQCFQCIEWNCRVQGNCLAYNTGVTYFAMQYEKKRKNSNLKLVSSETIFNEEIIGDTGIVSFMRGNQRIFNYTTIQRQGTERWSNETDINVNVNFRSGNKKKDVETCECVRDYGAEHCYGCQMGGNYTLNIAPNLITDFSLNGTNGITFTYTFANVLTIPTCCQPNCSNTCNENEYTYESCGDNCCYCQQHNGINKSYDERCKIGKGAIYTSQKKYVNGKEGIRSVYTGNVELYTNGIEINGNITFSDPYGTCPGFQSSRNACEFGYTVGDNYSSTVIINGIEYNNKDFIFKYTLPYELSGLYDGGEEIVNWTGCVITINPSGGDWLNKDIEIEFVLSTGDGAFKVGEPGLEAYYTKNSKTLTEASREYGGDNSFFFYISQPQWIKIGENNDINGILGSIYYDINFSDYVADEYYNIKGKAIIDGYQMQLEINKPTQNYANPKSNLFTFPEYNDNP